MILERAYTHQVYPLLYRNLRDLGFPGIPEQVRTELKGLYLANAIRDQLLAEELTRLVSLLGKAGIPVTPLKGVTLAQTLCGDPAARVCSDIDLLVPTNEVVRYPASHPRQRICQPSLPRNFSSSISSTPLPTAPWHQEKSREKRRSPIS